MNYPMWVGGWLALLCELRLSKPVSRTGAGVSLAIENLVFRVFFDKKKLFFVRKYIYKKIVRKFKIIRIKRFAL